MDTLLLENTSTVLNKLLEVEFLSAMLYEKLAIECDKKGFLILKDYLLSQKNEELTHYDKIREYILDRNCTPELLASISSIEVPKDTSYRGILQAAYDHELLVEKYWKQAKDKFKKDEDATSCAFAHWFLMEQIEEIAKFADYITAFDSDIYNSRIIVDNMLKK